LLKQATEDKEQIQAELEQIQKILQDKWNLPT
jgi:hypothetical protein